MHRRRTIIIGLLIVAVMVATGVILSRNKDKAGTGTTHSTAAISPPQMTSKPSFNVHQYSFSDPTSIWVVVNKQRPLNPVNYAPADLVVPNVPLRVPGNESMQLRQVTATALETMFTAAKQQGINLMLSSGYRSYSYQVSLYNSYVQTQGKSAADTFSARPGYSEHQTGLAADVEPVSEQCDVDQCFAQLPEGKWLAANAYKYGFIIRYPEGATQETGYEAEPWHVRYIGVPAATEMHKEGVTVLEKFFGLPFASGY